MLIFTALGLTATAGLTVGVALRLNQVVMILLGLGTLIVLNPRTRKKERRIQELPCRGFHFQALSSVAQPMIAGSSQMAEQGRSGPAQDRL